MDDILGEESDNESEGRGKEKAGNEDEEEQRRREAQPREQAPGPLTGGGPSPQALRVEDPVPTTCADASQLATVSR